MNEQLKWNRQSATNYGQRVSGRISALGSLLLSFALTFTFVLAHAQESKGEPPLEENKLGVVIFAVLFFGSCIGVCWYMWSAEKKRKREQKPKE
jgi:hypothetical protein